MAHIFAPFHVTNQTSKNDVIFGQDFLRELGINLDFQNNFVGWKETKISMKLIKSKMRTNFIIQERKNIQNAIDRIEKKRNNN